MKITLITVGKIKEKYLKDAIAEYSKRLSKYCKLTIVEVADEKTPDQASETVEEAIRTKEGERILKVIKDDMYESQCREFFGGDFVQTAVDEAIAPVGIFGPAMGIGHSVGIVAPECVYEESAVGYAFAEVCFVCGIQHSRTACQYIIYRVAECYHDRQLRLVALVVLMIGVIERLVAGVQITATGNKQQYAP